MVTPPDRKLAAVNNPAARISAVSPIAAHKPPPVEVRHRPEQRHHSFSLRLVLIGSLIILGISPVIFFARYFIPRAEAKIKDDTREEQLPAAAAAVTLLNDGLARQYRELQMLTRQFDLYTGSADQQERVGDLLRRRVLDRYVTEHLPYLEYISEDGSTRDRKSVV